MRPTRRPTAASTAISPRTTRCGTASRHRRARSMSGINRPTSPSRLFSRISPCTPEPRTTSGPRARSIKPTSPAGIYLLEHDVAVPDFNSYGSRRGNHEVMMRGTFANVRIKNLMLPPKPDGSRIEGGVTILQPEDKQTSIYEAAMTYIARGVSTMVFAGEEYGTGSSRDWAAKGTQLLGVKAVVARSFERIHRSNLVGMGVLPCQFKGADSVASLKIEGDEEFDLTGVEAGVRPQMDVTLTIRRKDGSAQKVPLLLRIDTPIEVDYYLHGGILPFVLRELLAA